MTLKETVLHELETADDLLLEDLLQVIQSRKHTTITVGENSRNGDRTPNHPLRGMPIAIPADFNQPMTDFLG